MKLKLLTIATALCLNGFSQGKDLQYSQDTIKLKGYYAAPPPNNKLEKRPGIIVLPAWMGITAHEKTSADKLSQLGYHALVADIYGEKAKPGSAKEAAALSGFYKKNYAVYQSRIEKALETLVKQGADADNIVVMGYCFGGTGALEAGRGGLPVKGIVSIHGGLGKDSTRAYTPIKPAVLILHGADDPFVSEKDIKSFQQELRRGKTDWQMNYYSGAVHAFSDPAAGNDNSKGTAYNKKADERSWKAMVTFMEELFR
jgi:dienelactone hydrolase